MRLSWCRRLLITGLIVVWPGLCLAQGLGSPTGDPLWGPSWEQRQLSAEAAIAKYRDCPTGGCIVRLEKAAVTPVRAKRGEKMHLSMAYTILTPEQVAIPVTLSREIFHQGKSLGKVKVEEIRQTNGTWESQVDFTLPAEAAPGTYSVVTKVTTGYGSDLKSVPFVAE